MVSCVYLEEQKRAIDYFPAGRTPRPEQTKAVSDIEDRFEAGSSIVAFEGPTGVGKTFVGMAHANQTKAAGQSTFAITVQKVLQEQYANDFPAPEIEVLKGRTNYDCNHPMTPDRDASRGFCRSTKKNSIVQDCLHGGTVNQAKRFELRPEDHKCPYWIQLTRAMEAHTTLFNFHSFLFQTRLGRFDARDLMIIDECHAIEGVLLGFVEISFSVDALKKIGIKLDLTLKNAKEVLLWAQKIELKKAIVDKLGAGAFSEDVGEGLTPQENDQLKTLLSKLETLEQFVDSCEWVVDIIEEFDGAGRNRSQKLRVRPVFVSLFARSLIFSHARRVIAMSATILDPVIWARNLGLTSLKPAYVQAPCLFPVKNRPIFLDYGGNLSWKTFDAGLPGVLRKINEIMTRHAGQRGIIHAHSEKLVRLIVDSIKSPRFLSLDMYETRDKTALLEDHADREDSIIVASAFHEGVDLKDGLARFSIIAKTPWPGTGDPLVKARMEADGSFLPYQAALKVVQSAGRGVRHKEDFCNTYVVDSGFERLLSNAGSMFPKWFTQAFSRPERR
jgi:Rad3-related DNA helicase